MFFLFSIYFEWSNNLSIELGYRLALITIKLHFDCICTFLSDIPWSLRALLFGNLMWFTFDLAYQSIFDSWSIAINRPTTSKCSRFMEATKSTRIQFLYFFHQDSFYFMEVFFFQMTHFPWDFAQNSFNNHN